jgi:hypothetical protein
MQREGEAENRDGVHVRGGPARDSGTRRAATDEEREPAQLVFAEPVDHCPPGRVQLASRSGRATTRDAIRLLDERDAKSGRPSGFRRCDEVRRRDPAPGAVSQHEHRDRSIDRMEMDPRGPVRRVELEDRSSLPRVGRELESALVSGPVVHRLAVGHDYVLEREFEQRTQSR